MRHNLVVAFDGSGKLRQLELIASALDGLGVARSLFGHMWYLRSDSRASDAARVIAQVMDDSDCLMIFDLTENECAMLNVSEPTAAFMSRYWHHAVAQSAEDETAEAAQTLHDSRPVDHPESANG